MPYGCTDPAATNYDPNATCDDGTCCFGGGQLLIDITTDNYPQEISWELTTQSGTVIASINAGDLNSSGTNYSWSVCVNNNECYNFTINIPGNTKHIEVVKIEFDSNKITFGTILKLFFSALCLSAFLQITFGHF